MTDKRPDPLVPAEVDLRGYEFMPYYGDRLRESDLNSRATDAEYRAAHNLWWSAWKQVPAASLPSDDITLARLADLGRDLKTWGKVKARALHGFVQCFDGRYYHRVLAPLAVDAWEFRNKQRHRTEAARNARLSQKGGAPQNRSVTDSTGQDRTGQDSKPTAAITTERQGTGLSTADPKAAAAAGLIYPEKLTTAQRKEAATLLGAHPRAQDMLDELEGKMRTERVDRPLGFLTRLVAQCADGKFTTERAAAIQVEREGRQAKRELEAAGRTASGERQPA